MELTTLPNYALIEISKDEKEHKFYKEVKMANGKTMKLTLDIPEASYYDGHFSQGVSIARIVALGAGIDFMQPGEEVIIDYTIDTEKAKIIDTGDGRRIVRAVAVNKFYTEDAPLTSATTESRYETREYKIGDLELASTIFGIIRGNEIIPNYPYVFLKYVNIEGEFEETESGLIIPSSEGEIVIRQVLFAHPNSPMQPGQNVTVDFGSLYEREVNGELISICMERDIFGGFQ